jgi:hypothetical protein
MFYQPAGYPVRGGSLSIYSPFFAFPLAFLSLRKRMILSSEGPRACLLCNAASGSSDETFASDLKPCMHLISGENGFQENASNRYGAGLAFGVLRLARIAAAPDSRDAQHDKLERIYSKLRHCSAQ